MRTIAIGDVHGCAQALEVLLRMIEIAANDRIVMLGDYVDRGPDSRGVLDLLLELQPRCRLIPLLGNHEIMLFGALEDRTRANYWLQFGGQTTLASYGSLDRIPEDHLVFLHHCRPFFETDNHIFLHANYAADVPLREQPEYLLFWEHLLEPLPPPHCSGKKVIVGHTPQVSGEILDVGHLACIDTYCFGTGWLTALDVDNGTLWQVDKEGNPRA